MSTKPPRRNRGVVAGACALAALAGCASPPAGGEVSRFSQIGFHARREAPPAPAEAPTPAPARSRVAAGPPALRPRLPAPETGSGVLPASLAQAQMRLDTYLDQAGFASETRPEGGGVLISATRMAAPGAIASQATCALEAMRRPDFSSTEVNVRLSPAPGGVQVQTSARFVLIDTRIISRELARQTCRTNGALEAAVRRAVAGG